MDEDTSTQDHPLLLLADRCEREETTYALEMEIAIAAGGYARASTTGYTSGGIVWRGDAGTKCPAYCSSLDAVATLEPDDAQEICVRRYRDGGAYVRITLANGKPIYSAEFGKPIGEPRARCAAALRALAVMAKAEAK